MPHNPKNASKASPVPWRELLPVHPAAEIVPMMTDAEIDALADDIKQNKLQQNVVIFVDHDRSESWLDGRNRLEALARLGIHPVRRSLFKGRPAEVVLPLDDAFSTGVSKVYADDVDPDDYVGSANAHRRHLTPEGKQHALEDVRTAKDKRAAIEDALKANPHLSDRQIAERQNCDNKTVAAVRARLEDREEIPHVEVRTDSKGRQQPAGKPPKATPGQTMIPVEQRLAQNAADEALINVADAEVPSEPSAETVSDDSAKPSPPAPRLGEPDPLSRHPSLRSPSRRPTPSVSPPKRTTSADIMTAWLYAPVEERGRFVMNVGKEVLAHFPDDWVPAVEAWLASKQTPRVLN